VDLSSLPGYPQQPRPQSAEIPAGHGSRISPRQVRVLFDLAALAAIVLFLFWVRHVVDTIHRPPPPPTEPLDFELVQERFPRVKLNMRKEEVFQLLGPERSANFDFMQPEIDEINGRVEAHPDRYIGPEWAIWADPENNNNWGAVFFSDGKVMHIIRKGF
jgi:hypothetical protein